jgi:hypothetical protein
MTTYRKAYDLTDMSQSFLEGLMEALDVLASEHPALITNDPMNNALLSVLESARGKLRELGCRRAAEREIIAAAGGLDSGAEA